MQQMISSLFPGITPMRGDQVPKQPAAASGAEGAFQGLLLEALVRAVSAPVAPPAGSSQGQPQVPPKVTGRSMPGLPLAALAVLRPAGEPADPGLQAEEAEPGVAPAEDTLSPGSVAQVAATMAAMAVSPLIPAPQPMVAATDQEARASQLPEAAPPDAEPLLEGFVRRAAAGLVSADADGAPAASDSTGNPTPKFHDLVQRLIEVGEDSQAPAPQSSSPVPGQKVSAEQVRVGQAPLTVAPETEQPAPQTPVQQVPAPQAAVQQPTVQQASSEQAPPREGAAPQESAHPAPRPVAVAGSAQPDSHRTGQQAQSPEQSRPEQPEAVRQVEPAKPSGGDQTTPLAFRQPETTRPEAPAAFAEGAPTHKPMPEQVLSQVTRFMKVALEGARSEARFQLHPENLGSVAVKLVLQEGAVRADLTAHDPAVKAILEANLDQLRSRLQDQGLRVEQLQVAVGGGSHFGQPHHSRQGEQRQPRQQGGRPAYPTAGAEPVTTPAPQQTASLWSLRGPGRRINTLA